jgi:hypothetical protein
MVQQSLKRNIVKIRMRASDVRRAYNQDYMAVPCRWLADVYDEVAAVFEARLAEIEKAAHASEAHEGE